MRRPDPSLLFPEGGYFVEAGAHDGIGDSTTYRLELAGWRGLCVEPSGAFKGLSESRKCSVDSRAVWCEDAPVVFRQVLAGDTELSGIPSCFYDSWDRTHRPHEDKVVQGVKLSTLLREHNVPRVVEYLSLDTEGSELSILLAHDFAAYRFLLMSVEHNNVPERREALKGALPNYVELHSDEVESWFVWRG